MEDYVVFSGGGCNGVLHIGAWAMYLMMRLSQQPDWKPKGVCGTSIGAVMALLVAIQYPLKQAIQLFKENVRIFQQPISIISFIENNVIFDLEKIKPLLKQCVHQMLGVSDITFRELWHRENIKLVICACNISNLTRKLFSDTESPNVSVVDAVLSSMCLPIIFRPQIVDGQLYIDGGLMSNLVIDVFPKSKTCFFWIRSRRNYIEPSILLNSQMALARQVVQGVWISSDEMTFLNLRGKGRLFELPVVVQLVEIKEINWNTLVIRGAWEVCQGFKSELGKKLFILVLLLLTQ